MGTKFVHQPLQLLPSQPNMC